LAGSGDSGNLRWQISDRSSHFDRIDRRRCALHEGGAGAIRMRQSTQSFGRAALAKVRHVFRPREIIFRSEGRVGCIRLSTRWQVTVFLVGAAASAWLISSSVGWLLTQQRLAAVDPELRHTRQAYSALLAEVQQNYRQVANLAEDLQSAGVPTGTAGSSGSAGAIAAARAALKQKLDGFQSDLQRLVDLNRTLNRQITDLTERVQAGEAEKHRLVEAGAALEERVRRLSLALASANDEHQSLTGRIATLEGQMALSQRTQQVLVSVVEQSQTAASRNSLVRRNVLYPLQRLWSGGGPEDALVLAVMRQESRFSMTAVSPAGARGMMQLMPDTAREMASRMNIGYTVERLTSDADFNIALGRAYLDQLLNLFDRSYVLAVAAYNAGPARVLDWMRRFGDPRDPSIDVDVWVRSIPYAETRIYVQRVMQNLQDFRGRLNSQTADRCRLNALNSRAS
jgi:soluble lytic murein transglycosylase-like protein